MVFVLCDITMAAFTDFNHTEIRCVYNTSGKNKARNTFLLEGMKFRQCSYGRKSMDKFLNKMK